MKNFLKNIIHNKVQNLKDLISIETNQITSKTFVQNSSVSITIFGFDKNEEISTHKSTGDAMVIVLEGSGEFRVGDAINTVCAGQTLVMPAGIDHSVFAKEKFKWLLIVIFPENCDIK